jgi:hypothetical protein
MRTSDSYFFYNCKKSSKFLERVRLSEGSGEIHKEEMKRRGRKKGSRCEVRSAVRGTERKTKL